VEVDDEVLHFRVVDRALRSAAPRLERAGVVGKDPDDLDRLQILEVKRARIAHAPAHHEVEELLLAVGHLESLGERMRRRP
jgi:hypothetical protein